MSSSNRRRDLSPSRSGVGSSKLRMDRQPIVTRISGSERHHAAYNSSTAANDRTDSLLISPKPHQLSIKDPSLTIGRRKEIDNVMKKARAATNDYWDKKLLEVEEKDPNRWRHTGYKKMYIEGESSSESDRDTFRYNRNRNSRSRSRNRKSPQQLSPTLRKRALSPDTRRRSPPSPLPRGRRTPDPKRPRSPEMRRRPRSPPEPPARRKSSRSPRSPIVRKHISPSPISRRGLAAHKPRGLAPSSSILPRSKRPPSPPPKGARTPSNSSLSSCSDESCSVCSPKTKRVRSRSISNSRQRNAPLSPHSPHLKSGQSRGKVSVTGTLDTGHRSKRRPGYIETSGRSNRPPSPSGPRRSEEKRLLTSKNHRIDDKNNHGTRDRLATSRSHVIDDDDDSPVKHTSSRSNRQPPPEYPGRTKTRLPDPAQATLASKKKGKDKIEKLRARIKIEGEKRKQTGKHKEHKEKEKEHESSESEESTESESSFPAFAATTRLTLSERFGKMAQWSVDRSNMENMRITKDSTGGALKVMIEEGLETPPRRYSYSPAPQGHFPEELATTAPTGLMSWDDVRVRYEYYKSRGYLRDLDLKDYVKWEEWWYRYQEWLKQERYYEFYERQQLNRRRRKKVPITQRLN